MWLVLEDDLNLFLLFFLFRNEGYVKVPAHLQRLDKAFEFDILWNSFVSVSLPTSPGSGLNDGQWHAIRLVAKDNFAMLTIDGDDTSAARSASPLAINTGGTYHLGGEGQHAAVTSDLTTKQEHYAFS